MNCLTQGLQSVVSGITFAVTECFKATYGQINLWLLRNCSGQEVANSDVVLILVAKYDHNGAMSMPHPIATYKLHHQPHSKIVYREVSTLYDISRAIDDVKSRSNRITGLWINAHGNSRTFRLGNKRDVVTNFDLELGNLSRGRGNADRLRPALQRLEPGAPIILLSCLTGRIDKLGNRSIAQTFASLAPTSTVYAPTKEVNGYGFHFSWDAKMIQAKFSAPKISSSGGILGKLTNIFNELLYVVSFGHYSDDITAIYRHYPAKAAV